jgi:hypothetical protein
MAAAVAVVVSVELSVQLVGGNLGIGFDLAISYFAVTSDVSWVSTSEAGSPAKVLGDFAVSSPVAFSSLATGYH